MRNSERRARKIKSYFRLCVSQPRKWQTEKRLLIILAYELRAGCLLSYVLVLCPSTQLWKMELPVLICTPACLSHFYFACRFYEPRISYFFISHLAFLSRISHFFISHLVFLSRYYLQKIFSSLSKSHLECPLQASLIFRPCD